MPAQSEHSKDSTLSSPSKKNKRKSHKPNLKVDIPNPKLKSYQRKKSIMRMNRTWSVKCPPVLQTSSQHKAIQTLSKPLEEVTKPFVSPFLHKQKRRICIEIHGQALNDDDAIKESGRSSEVKAPTTRGLTRTDHHWTTASRNVVDLSSELKDDDRVVIRILKPRKAWGFSRQTDDSSSSSSSSDEDDDSDMDKDNMLSGESDDMAKLFEIDDGWVEYRKWGLDEVSDDKLLKNKLTWQATLGVAAVRERRDIIFESQEQAQDFVTEISTLRELVGDRAAKRIEAYQEAQGVDMTDEITPQSTDSGALIRSPDDLNTQMMTATAEISLLIEIVSATDLPIADIVSSDPYVVVYLGNQKIHKTGYISKTLNPIWTVDNGSLFILSLTAEEFFTAGQGLTFVLKDFDSVAQLAVSNDVICRKTINIMDLLNEDNYGKRVSYELRLLSGMKASSKIFNPKLNLRVRKATPYDKIFMKQLMKIQKVRKKTRSKLIKEAGIYSHTAFVAPKPDEKGYNPFRRETKIIDGIKKHRVKPGPDPSRDEAETAWMTGKQLEEEVMKPSSEWLEAGSGTLGKLYFEVLKCDDLPDMDTSPGKGDVTDSFCTIIYEDAIVNTNVINNELSPRWMPWTQRAFCFNVNHPSDMILVGVFDFDSAKGLNDHDHIGRISIDITNFREETEYVLTYDLYSSVLDDVRKKYGTITVRVRLEYESYRDLFKASLRLPELNYINLANRNDFTNSFFVCNGEENLQKLDVGAIWAYKSELMGHIEIYHYIVQSLLTVVFWRGHYRIKLFGRDTYLPIHSMVAFLMGIYAIENFNLIPSFSLFSIAWLLLATNEHRQRDPSPWKKSLTFAQMWHAILVDEAPPVAIASHENENAVRIQEEFLTRRHDRDMRKAEEATENAKKLGAFLVAENSSAEENVITDMSTKVGGRINIGIPSIAAMILLPAQQNLGKLCKGLRSIHNFLMWNEPFYAFNLCNACLAVGFVLLFVPWHFFVRWKIRITIWVFLGPWMKFVDVFYVRKWLEGEKNETEAFRKFALKKAEQIALAKEVLMLKKEEIMKMRAMKTYMFGKHITRIPKFKVYRFPDIPRPESSATALTTKAKPVNISRFSHGQKLTGQMIPIWGDAEVDSKKTTSGTPAQTRLLQELSFDIMDKKNK